MKDTHRSADTGHPGNEENLKGTFVSVLILGAVVAVSWLTVFTIFMVRNGG